VTREHLSLVHAVTVQLCEQRCWQIVLQEFYGDFIAVSPHLMSLNIVGCSEVSGAVDFPTIFIFYSWHSLITS